MKYTPKEIEGNVNVSHTSPLKELLLLLAGIFGILALLYILLGFAVDVVVMRLPPEIEQHLGSLYANAFSENTSTPAEEYLQTLLNKLVQKSSLHKTGVYTIHLYPSSQTNAFALPGGHIIVLSALLEDVKSENELAFVLAHELGHFANRDHLRGLGRGLVITAISAVLLGADNSMTTLLMNSLLTIEMKFSQSQETQADLFGIDLVNTYYGHIEGATDFFQKIADEEKRGRLSYFFATHPYPKDRVIELQDYIRQKGYTGGEKLPLDERLKDYPQPPISDDESLEDILRF